MRTAMVVMAVVLNIPVEYNDSAAEIARKLDDKLSTICYLASPFKAPLRVSDKMKIFLRSSGLEKVAPLAVHTAVTEGITTKAILTPLLTIYTTVNNMQYPTPEQNYLRSTSLMDRVFKDTYNNIRETKPDFNPDKMKYAMLQSIISKNVNGDNILERDSRFESRLNDAQVEASNALQRVRTKRLELTQMNL